MPMYRESLNTPLGVLQIEGDPKGITGIFYVEKRLPDLPHPYTHQAKKELEAYFSGEIRSFSVPCHPSGTVFQQKVWQALLNVPYGHTATYGEIARSVGSPRAVRAVGQANRVNPLSIVIPCHRVIGSNGKLTGYAGGLDRKRYLLELERKCWSSSPDHTAESQTGQRSLFFE